MAKGLREHGLLAPEIHHADLKQGLLVIEDLGDERVVAGDPPVPIEERYETAVDALLALHDQALPDRLPVAPHLEYQIPAYDLEAFLIEAELFIDWYLPRLDLTVPDPIARLFRALWSEALTPALEAPPTWVLRDYHSPNLLWLPQHQGSGAARHPGFPGCRDGTGRLRSGLAAAGRPRRRRQINRARAVGPLSAPAARRRSGFRRRPIHQDLRDARGATRQQDSRHIRAARPARRQAAIPASHAAHMGLLAAFAGASGAGAAQRMVCGAHSGYADLSARASGARMSDTQPRRSTKSDRVKSDRVVPDRAMVLAAGLGTRMRPFNGQVPKPLVQVGGKALIDHVLDRLADTGVERAVVNVHHLADQIEQHLRGRQRPRIIISDERHGLLGTGGGVVKALDQLGDAPFFHVNSDTIWIDGVQPNLGRLAAAFEPERMDALLLLAPTATSTGYAGRGDYAMTPDGRLVAAASATWCRSSMRAPPSWRPRCSAMRRPAPFR